MLRYVVGIPRHPPNAQHANQPRRRTGCSRAHQEPAVQVHVTRCQLRRLRPFSKHAAQAAAGGEGGHRGRGLGAGAFSACCWRWFWVVAGGGMGASHHTTPEASECAHKASAATPDAPRRKPPPPCRPPAHTHRLCRPSEGVCGSFPYGGVKEFYRWGCWQLVGHIRRVAVGGSA